ncbi:something about silencing protein 10 [Eupeodes corollae]|uniref:something about silencing protein 10 n=1 Tax=Eupeodes corollae TaxID=290404 RepID=UPI0024930F2C|nr:something about silencing protein 10 [Eupeodes corollae]
MADKLFLNNDDIPYEPSESEDELSEVEKEILKEVRRGKKKKSDPKQEILAFDESADSDDEDAAADDIIGDSDIERGDEYDGIPDSKAWGKQRRSYYNTDFVDQDYSAYNEQEEEQAQQEEEEAKAIQMRLAKQLDEADFFLDLPTGDGVSASDDDEHVNLKAKSKKSDDQSTYLKSDFSNMSQRQIQQLFKKDSPEFEGLVEDFHTYLDESKNILTPVIEFANSMEINLPIFDFVRTRDNMVMTYCTNVAFYLLLKSQRISIKNHPITKRLVTLKKLINQVQQRYEDVVKPQLEELLRRINSGEEVEIDLKPVEKVKEKSKKKLRALRESNGGEDGDSGEEYDEEPSSKRVKMLDEDDDGTTDEDAEEEGEEGEEDEGDAERRGITYQIAKNKGLMPHRKKELRNPRVKHRSKFRKALIRRKGAVRTVRKETQRYGGEMSGIKATTKKGIKIKS